MVTMTTSVMADSQNIQAVGAQNFANYCLSCHNSMTPDESRIAPTMHEIKQQYLQQDSSELAFVSSMTEFVLNPSTENIKMSAAFDQYGMMPNMGLTEDMVKPIARFIYHSSVVKDNWFESHRPQQQTQMTYSEQGKKYALATKAILGKNLMSAIKTKGTTGALAFCNEQAIPLTEAAAAEHQVKIKRVSDKNRNPNNQANPAELQYINDSKLKLQKGEKISGQVTETAKKAIGYYPIMTNEMCLQCHGIPDQDIDQETAEQINKLYPNDLATGYGTNELRGIWVIEMPKKEVQ